MPPPPTWTRWLEIQALYPVRVTRRISLANSMGLSGRLAPSRLTRLVATKPAQALLTRLSAMEPDAIKSLRIHAALNEEQARAAFRTTMVANVSAPLIGLAVINQSFPGWLSNWVNQPGDAGAAATNAVAVFIVIGILTIALITFYALSAANHARDLRHLIDIGAAARGVYFGAEDADGMIEVIDVEQ